MSVDFVGDNCYLCSYLCTCGDLHAGIAYVGIQYKRVGQVPDNC